MARVEDKCSFCSKPRKEVDLLIAGLSGNICEKCVEAAFDMVTQDKKQA